MSNSILKFVYTLTLIIVFILIYIQLRKLNKRLNKYYLKKGKGFTSYLDQINFLRQIAALFFPTNYFEKRKLKEGYELLVVNTLLNICLAIIFILFAGSFLGALIGSFYLFLSKKSKNEPLPFGPFLAGATLIYLFFGSEIMNWYVNTCYYGHYGNFTFHVF